MDPSHVRRRSFAEIERVVAAILSRAYPKGIKIPIGIDRLVQKINIFAQIDAVVEDIVYVPALKQKHDVDAVLYRKGKTVFDVVVDEDSIEAYPARVNFSMAHEIGHLILHRGVFDDCLKLEDSLALSKRIRSNYMDLEREANVFAGALLMPMRTVPEHAARFYEFCVKEYGYDRALIQPKLCARLAENYKVSYQPMEIRLKELGLVKKIDEALAAFSPYIDP